MNRFGASTGEPSTLSAMPPKICRFSPVAVMITSARNSWPEPNRIPPDVKVSMVSVTIRTRPLLMASKRSPSVSAHTR
ncbi:Uncharacterised protein [Mycobacteroides abscessus subsp. abscessus]|nr:Uncharacterised protein [Mycobacteroides abscessus subsp. abscessus]